MASLALTASLTGCFTGIESTPKISERDVKRQNISLTEKSTVLAGISGQAPSSWKAGKQFYVTDERFRRATRLPDSDTTAIEGTILTLATIDTVPSLTGESRIELVFNRPNGPSALFATGITTDHWSRLESLDLPFLIELDMISKVRDRLIGKRYYFLASRRLDSNNKEVEGLRYNPVTITEVSTGDTNRPLKVSFKDGAGNIYSTLITLGNEPTSLRNFETLFSTDNPRKKYPRITDDVWELIQNSKVRLGMTPEECRLALGSPDNYRRIPTTAGIVEQWSFNNGSFLTFEDGILVRFRL